SLSVVRRNAEASSRRQLSIAASFASRGTTLLASKRLSNASVSIGKVLGRAEKSTPAGLDQTDRGYAERCGDRGLGDPPGTPWKEMKDRPVPACCALSRVETAADLQAKRGISGRSERG